MQFSSWPQHRQYIAVFAHIEMNKKNSIFAERKPVHKYKVLFHSSTHTHISISYEWFYWKIGKYIVQVISKWNPSFIHRKMDLKPLFCDSFFIAEVSKGANDFISPTLENMTYPFDVPS